MSIRQKITLSALSKEDLKGLRRGHGTPFGDMAKAAELNGFPGPRHVLDLKRNGLTSKQVSEIEEIYRKMNLLYIKVGAELVAKAFMDREFKEKRVNSKSLKKMIQSSAVKYSELRYIQLVAHLETAKILKKGKLINIMS